MKKTFLIIALGLSTIVYFSSCKKCSTCTAKDASGAQVGTSGEMCEKNKEELESVESTYRNAQVLMGNTVTCQDK